MKAVERLGLDLNPAKLFSILRGPSSKAWLGRELAPPQKKTPAVSVFCETKQLK